MAGLVIISRKNFQIFKVQQFLQIQEVIIGDPPLYIVGNPTVYIVGNPTVYIVGNPTVCIVGTQLYIL